MRFTKKPVTINAWSVRDLVDAFNHNRDLLPPEVVVAREGGIVAFGDDYLSIDTLEGVMTAGLTDWLIQGVQGELYPCKNDIFAATYDVAGPEDIEPEVAPEPVEADWSPCEVCGAVWEETSPGSSVMRHADECPNNTRTAAQS